jgi:hypothetical protein
MNTVSCTVPFNALQRRPHVSNPVWSTVTVLDDDTELITRRVIQVIEPAKENAIQFVKDCQWDKHPDTFPVWNMIEEYFPRLRALPGAGMVVGACRWRGCAGTEGVRHVRVPCR